MASNLISPGTSISVIDQSYYVPGIASSIPLIFIATGDEKTQSDGLTPAQGTYESGVVRLVTSVSQALQLYGNPSFLSSPTGAPYHGDARNEYGLEALIKALQVGNQVYVVRANINLDDNLDNIKALWERKIQDAGSALSVLVQDYIQTYNASNGLIPIDLNYKVTVDGAELKPLIDQALTDVFSSYSFSSQNYQNAFIQDHTVPYPGYQDVLFDSTGGYLQLSDVTGLTATSNYGAEVEIVSGTGTHTYNLAFTGSDIVTFGELVSAINATLGSDGSAELLNGRLRILSSLTGVTSSVTILSDGPSGKLPLFSSLTLYSELDNPVSGTGAGALDTYDVTYTTVVGSYDGLDGMINDWNAGGTVPDEFTSNEAEGLLLAAATDFEATREFSQFTSLGANDAARRAAIVKQLVATISDPNTGVTGDNFEYNILACPGYPEVTGNLVTLSQSVREEVFVVGDTPMNKAPTGPTGITAWAATPARTNNYLNGYWYPHGLTTNIDGSTILASAASTAIRTLLFNDINGELWYAPAGTSRGTCPQLNNIGYVSGTLGGPTQFVQNFIDQGTRDALYTFPINVNPVSYIPGRGILVMGEKTSAPASSALDRVGVARLVAYMRRELRKAVFPYLFEPDDKKTWDQVKFTCDSFLNTLVSRRGLYDFLTVCDSSNNTGDTIDRNELHVEIYIKPTKAVEFIYVDLTLVNTAADLSAASLA